MKKLTVKQKVSGLLISACALPGLANADDACCMTTTAPLLQGIKTSVDGILGKMDISNQQLANALINYEAAARIKEYQLNQQLLFMVAPGTSWAINAGAVAGASDMAATALKFSDTSLVYNLGGLTKASNVTIDGNSIPVTQAQTPLDVFSSMSSFFESGDTSKMTPFNPGALLHSKNLNTANITSDQTQALINNLTNPSPLVDSSITDKVKAGGSLDGEDKEKIAETLSAYPVMGLSISALSDIAARRTPASGQTKSVMEIMDDYSKQRFTSPDWYAAIGAASEASLLREIAHMLAYQSWVAYQQFRVAEQQMALMATFNAVMAKANSQMEQMNKQMAAAQAQANAQSQQVQQQVNEQNQKK